MNAMPNIGWESQDLLYSLWDARHAILHVKVQRLYIELDGAFWNIKNLG